MTTIKRIQTIPANYATKNGEIIIEATGGRKPYEYSIDGGLTFSKTKEFLCYGGSYEVIIRDSDGNLSEPQDIRVEKVLSDIQAEYLNNLFDSFGNESQAANATPSEFTKSGTPIAYLPPRTVHNWRKDPDFAKFVSEMKLDANAYLKDFLESKLISLINGGIPIYAYVADPNDVNLETGMPKDINKRVRIQTGETLPDAGLLKFVLERKFKDDYSLRTELTGKGGDKIIAIGIEMEDMEDEEMMD